MASLSVQMAGLVLSFSTCSPAPSWHKGTHLCSELQRFHGYQAFRAQGDLSVREITILEQRTLGHPWECPWD